MIVREWMTAPPIASQSRMSAHEALRLMELSKVRRLPVEDEGRLVGIVTKGDIQSKLGPFPLSWRRLNLRVTDVMTREPFHAGTTGHSAWISLRSTARRWKRCSIMKRPA